MRSAILGLAIAAGLGAAGSAHAQLNSGPQRKIALVVGTQVGRGILLKDGDIITYEGKPYVVGKDFIAVPAGREVQVNGVTAIVMPRHVWNVATFPSAVFSVSGSLIRQSDGALIGGTKSITGQVYAADGVFSLDHNRALEVGGFYFQSYDEPTDLYMLAVRYFPSPKFGFQVGYIDSTRFPARSTSYMLVYRLSSSDVQAPNGRPFQVELGVGVVNNLSKDFDFNSASYVSRASVNFSTYVEVSYEFKKNWRLLGSQWFIRDRNNDVSRFGIGVGYQF